MPESAKDQVRRVIDSVTPKVIERTGYQLDLDNLGIEVIPKKEFGQIALRNSWDGLNVRRPISNAERFWLRVQERMLNNAYGIYNPSLGSLLVNDKGFGFSVDEIGLHVAHELVHRGQHISRPTFNSHRKKMEQQFFDSVNIYSPINRQTPITRTHTILAGFAESEAYRVTADMRSTSRLDDYIGMLALLPILLKEGPIIKKWIEKRLKWRDRDIIMHNPGKIALFYFSDKTPTQLLEDSERRVAIAA